MTDLSTSQMQWVNALSTCPSLEAAVAEVVERTQRSLLAPATLGLVFVSSSFASDYSRLLPLLQESLPGIPLIGCGGSGIVGIDATGTVQEVEGKPALSLSLAHLPEVEVTTFQVSPVDLPDLDDSPEAWVKLVGVPAHEQPQFILLADPFTSRIGDLLQGLDFAYPNSAKVGGLVSGSHLDGGTALFCHHQHYHEGTVGLTLRGRIVIDTIVTQGCRPISEVYQVSVGERNLILGVQPVTETLDFTGKSAIAPLQVLRGLLDNLSEADRRLVQHSLFIGIARDEHKHPLESDDFLIRNLLGVDPRIGSIAVSDRVTCGQRVQFYLRDAQAAMEDLTQLLQRHQQRSSAILPQDATTTGAVMFVSLGRGEGLYGQPSFDARSFQHYAGNIPLIGFFSNGEIGPVGKETFLHSYSCVFGIFRQPT